MIKLETTFDDRSGPAELALLQPGQNISAMILLSLLEGEDDDGVQSTFDALERRDIKINVADLPAMFGQGETAQRLRKEHTMAQKGFDILQLEETDPLRLYLDELAAIPAFGDEELLAQRLLAGEQTQQQLIDLMLSLVWQRALEHTGKGVLLLDLIQEGSMGLVKGVANYTGGQIRGYCDARICFAMAKAVVEQALADGVGQKLRQSVEDYRAVDEQLLSELGRNATVEEIAEALHTTPDQASAVAGMLASARKLHSATAEIEKTPDDDQAVENTADFRMLERISELLSKLDETEAQLLKLRFGLEGSRPLSPEEAGHKLGLSADQVVSMEAAALAKLRVS